MRKVLLAFTAAIALASVAGDRPVPEKYYTRQVTVDIEPTDKRALGAKEAYFEDAYEDRHGFYEAMFAAPIFSPRPVADFTFVQGYTSSASSTTHTFTAANIGTANVDRIVYVVVSSGQRATGVTLATNAMTEIGHCSVSGDTGSGATIWKLAVPTGTTADIVVTSASTARCLIGVYQSTRTDYGLIDQAARINDASGTSLLAEALYVVQSGFVLVGAVADSGGSGQTISSISSTGTDGYTVDNVINFGSNAGYACGHARTTVNQSTDITVNFAQSSAARTVYALSFGPVTPYPAFLPVRMDWIGTTASTMTFPSCTFGRATANRMIAVCVMSTAGNVNSSTINGVAGTTATSQSQCTIVYAATSSGEVGSIVITLSASSGDCIIQWYRAEVGSSTPQDAQHTTATSTAVSVSLICKNGGFWIACSRTTTTSGSSTWSFAGTGTPINHFDHTYSTTRFSCASLATTVDETKNVTMTPSTSTNVNLVAASWL